MRDGAAAVDIARLDEPAGRCARPAADMPAVRLTKTPSASLTFTDMRPDGDGFGRVDADAHLLRQFAAWLGAQHGVLAVGCFLTDDAQARRQLVATVERWDVTGPRDAPLELVE